MDNLLLALLTLFLGALIGLVGQWVTRRWLSVLIVAMFAAILAVGMFWIGRGSRDQELAAALVRTPTVASAPLIPTDPPSGSQEVAAPGMLILANLGLADQVTAVTIQGGCATLYGDSASAETSRRECDTALSFAGDSTWNDHLKRIVVECQGRSAVILQLWSGEDTSRSPDFAQTFCAD